MPPRVNMSDAITEANFFAQSFMHKKNIGVNDELAIQLAFTTGRESDAKIQSLREKQTQAMIALAKELIRTGLTHYIEFWPLSDDEDAGYSYRAVGSKKLHETDLDPITPEQFLAKFDKPGKNA